MSRRQKTGLFDTPVVMLVNQLIVEDCTVAHFQNTLQRELGPRSSLMEQT
jgi:hypothetical protein